MSARQAGQYSSRGTGFPPPVALLGNSLECGRSYEMENCLKTRWCQGCTVARLVRGGVETNAPCIPSKPNAQLGTYYMLPMLTVHEPAPPRTKQTHYWGRLSANLLFSLFIIEAGGCPWASVSHSKAAPQTLGQFIRASTKLREKPQGGIAPAAHHQAPCLDSEPLLCVAT